MPMAPPDDTTARPSLYPKVGAGPSPGADLADGLLPLVIRSGGQTGVDRAALDFARHVGWPYTGWCPRGGWAEDYPMAPGVRTAYPLLAETPATGPEQRTAWNVRDGHATLIVSRPGDEDRSPGTRFTRLMAELVFLRPCRVFDPIRPGAEVEAVEWLRQLRAMIPSGPLVLTVAGPRESEAPGIYSQTFEFLCRWAATVGGHPFTAPPHDPRVIA